MIHSGSTNHSPTSSSHSNNSTSGRGGNGDGDSIFRTHNAEGLWLEQTIRYHEGRARKNGVLRCELWLSRRPGAKICRGHVVEQEEAVVALPDVVYCWHLSSSPKIVQTAAQSGIPKDIAVAGRPNYSNSRNNNNNNNNNHYLYRSKKEEISSTLLGERLANRLWSHHKDSSDCSVLWRRFGSLTGKGEASPTSRHRQEPIFPSPRNYSNFSIDWIASIPFGVPVVDGVAAFPDGDAGSTNSNDYRGMVCWLFEPTPTAMPSSAATTTTTIAENPPLNVECFLRLATNHIAATYAMESSFEPLSQFLSPSNPREITQSAPSKKQRPPELSYHEDIDSQYKNKRTTPTRSPLEIHGVEENYDDDNVNFTRSTHDGIKNSKKKKILLAIQTYVRKFKGSGHNGPQPLCWKQTLFTFVGSFVTIFFIQKLDSLIISIQQENTSPEPLELSQLDVSTDATTGEILKALLDDYQMSVQLQALEMGPFGATSLLVFAMTSVPPAQPRSLLAGATIGMVVGKLVGYLADAGVGIGIRMSLATALTACIMARTCTIYPPGGALAVIFSSRLLGWERLALQLIGTVLAIGLGVVINNLHPLRTYPTFWLGCKNGNSNEGYRSGGGGDGGGCRSSP